MISKEIELLFNNCQSMARISSDEGSGLITLSITEFEKDNNKSEPFHDVYEEVSTTEIYLGNKEVKALIQAFECSLLDDES